MVIYEVRNKVSCILFESEKGALVYLSKYGTPTNGLELCKVFVIPDKQDEHDKQVDEKGE